MRLLHLISEKPPVRSGFSTVIGKLAKELTNLGNEVDVLSTQECSFKAIGDIKIVLDEQRLVNKISEGNYQIINIHGHTPTFSDRLLLRSKLSGKKIVYTLHCLPDYYLKPIGKLYSKIFNNIAVKLSNAVVVTTTDYFEMLGGCSKKYLVPWGVDFKEFAGERKPHDRYHVLFVGQMRPYKGIKVLLQAIEGSEATLSVVGDGRYKADYEAYAYKLGLNNVQFLGSVSNASLKKMYLDSDVLVLPSVGGNEAFGLVTLEAAAAGCAVVASDLPGLRDVVREFGLIVKPNCPKDLRNAIDLLSDKDLRKKYVEKGYRFAASHSWRSVAEKYVEIYSQVSS